VKRPTRALRRAAVPVIPAAAAGLSVHALAGAVMAVVAVVTVVAALCWVIADPGRTRRLASLIAAARGGTGKSTTSAAQRPATRG
jgi:hypothetical protein